MIADPVVRWIVTLLFLFSAGVCIQTIAASRHSVPGVISHGLHAVMAIAMAVMAWPRGADLPSRGPMIFFFAAALWFVIITARSAGHRLVNAYHAFMMLAMAWMYAAMGGLSLNGGDSAPGPMPDMDMGSGSAGHAGHAGHGGHSAAGSAAAEAMSLPVLLNWVCVIAFALATVYWLYRLITARLQASGDFVGVLCQLAMAAGMAIMFVVMV